MISKSYKTSNATHNKGTKSKILYSVTTCGFILRLINSAVKKVILRIEHCDMGRYFLEVMYDGGAFHGSQIQNDTPTVQLAINQALSTLLRQEVETVGASRTDEGVHALCSYYHFDINEALAPNFVYRVNAILPPTISLLAVYQPHDDEMNARFAAERRRYRYKIHTYKNPFLNNRSLFYPFKIDVETLNKTAAIIKEHTDFETFSKRNTQTYTYNCSIFESYWEFFDNELHYVVEANRFLRGMVRGLVGTQLQVARGRHTIEEFRKIIESKDCNQADFSVAGHGLYLEHIQYPDGSLTEIRDKTNERNQ